MKERVHEEYRALRDHWWFSARRDIFATLLRDRGLPENARIADLGPGSGINIPVLASFGDVTVVDEDDASVRSCLAVGATRAVRGDATRPPLVAGAWDLVCALDVLEHLEDDDGALRAWRRMLAPGGTLLLTVPAFGLLWGRQDVLSGHHRRYRRRALGEQLRAAGFAVDRLTYFNTVLFPAILGVRLCMRPFLGASTAPGSKSDFGMPRFGLNSALHRVFAAEGGWLRRRNLPVGVSLLAVATAGTTPGD